MCSSDLFRSELLYAPVDLIGDVESAVGCESHTTGLLKLSQRGTIATPLSNLLALFIKDRNSSRQEVCHIDMPLSIDGNTTGIFGDGKRGKKSALGIKLLYAVVAKLGNKYLVLAVDSGLLR